MFRALDFNNLPLPGECTPPHGDGQQQDFCQIEHGPSANMVAWNQVVDYPPSYAQISPPIDVEAQPPYVPMQLALDPEILAPERTEFKTLGPMAERVRLAYQMHRPRLIRQLHEDYLDVGTASFVWSNNSSEEAQVTSTLPTTSTDPSELLSPIFPLESGDLPTISLDEPSTPLSSLEPGDLPLSHIFPCEGGPISTPLSPIYAADSDTLASLPGSIPSISNAALSSKLAHILHHPMRRRSNSLSGSQSPAISRNHWQGRRRSKSFEATALKGILRNGQMTRQTALNVGKPSRSVHFAETNSVRGSFDDTEDSSSRGSSISARSYDSTAGTTEHFAASRSSLSFLSPSRYFGSPSTASSASCSPSLDGYNADLESLSLNFTPRRLDDFFSPTHSPASSSMTPPLMSLLQYYIDADGSNHGSIDSLNPPYAPVLRVVSLPPSPSPSSHSIDDMVAQIVNSISGSATRLTETVLCEEPQSFLSEEPIGSSDSMSTACIQHGETASSVASSTEPTTAISRTAEDTVNTGPLKLFSHASQFGMRDPNFYAAQRDIKIIKVYNITINQPRASSTSTRVGGEG